MPDADGAHVIELERRLLSPEVRRDRAALTALLHEDFREVGASGRAYDRDAVIAALLTDDGPPPAAAHDFEATRLGPDAILVTYRTEAPSRRASVWVRAGGAGWRILYHQGTSATPA